MAMKSLLPSNDDGASKSNQKKKKNDENILVRAQKQKK